MPAAALLRFAIRGDAEIAGQLGHFVVFEFVAHKLAEYCRAMTAELLGTDVNGDAGMTPPFDLAAVIQISWE